VVWFAADRVQAAIIFSFRNGDGVKEGLHWRLAEAPAALMRPLLIVVFDP
jgi:hypothetical protein